jgi:hypothetical protein
MTPARAQVGAWFIHMRGARWRPLVAELYGVEPQQQRPTSEKTPPPAAAAAADTTNTTKLPHTPTACGARGVRLPGLGTPFRVVQRPGRKP